MANELQSRIRRSFIQCSFLAALLALILGWWVLSYSKPRSIAVSFLRKYWVVADRGTFQFRIGDRQERITDSTGHSSLAPAAFERTGSYPPASTLRFSALRIYSRGAVSMTQNLSVGRGQSVVTATVSVRAWVVAC